MDRISVTCVPLYETLGDNAIEFIITHSESKLVVAAGAKLPALLKALPKLKGALTVGIIYWGDAPADAVNVSHPCLHPSVNCYEYVYRWAGWGWGYSAGG